jgi:hypothetical protein
MADWDEATIPELEERISLLRERIVDNLRRKSIDSEQNQVVVKA